jgi:DNA-binding NtrC family response regulator
VSRTAYQILCINDRREELTAEREMFERAGFHVLTATTRAQTLQALRMHPIALAVVAGSHSPGRNALCAEMKRLRPDVWVIFQKSHAADRPAPAEADIVLAGSVADSPRLASITSLLLAHPAA